MDDKGTLIEITLPNNRSVWCWKYVAAYTYDGFMLRTPSERCNEHMLKVVRREVTQYFGELWPLHIIPPIRRPGAIDYPPIRITAFFMSSPMRDKMHLSSLVVVWFQNQQFPVPDEVGRAALETVDWERLALDYET